MVNLRRPAERFTPTGVGTIPKLEPAPVSKPVHPHGRGDNKVRSVASVLFGGSPPRAWGQFIARACGL